MCRFTQHLEKTTQYDTVLILRPQNSRPYSEKGYSYHCDKISHFHAAQISGLQTCLLCLPFLLLPKWSLLILSAVWLPPTFIQLLSIPPPALIIYFVAYFFANNLHVQVLIVESCAYRKPASIWRPSKEIAHRLEAYLSKASMRTGLYNSQYTYSHRLP